MFVEDCPTRALNNPDKWSLQGHSKAGTRTGFLLHPLKILLDAGISTRCVPRAVFITHKHVDHTSALPFTLTGRTGIRPVFMPQTAYEPVASLQRAIVHLSETPIISYTDAEIYARQGCEPRVVQPGDVFMIHNNVQVHVLNAYHDTESVGYGFSTVKKKLKTCFRDKTKAELADMARAGEVLTDTVVEPQVCFYCDSNIRNLANHDEWKAYPVMIVECTGADTNAPYRENHTRIHELQPFIDAYPDKQWVLIHTSNAFRVPSNSMFM